MIEIRRKILRGNPERGWYGHTNIRRDFSFYSIVRLKSILGIAATRLDTAHTLRRARERAKKFAKPKEYIRYVKSSRDKRCLG